MIIDVINITFKGHFAFPRGSACQTVDTTSPTTQTTGKPYVRYVITLYGLARRIVNALE